MHGCRCSKQNTIKSSPVLKLFFSIQNRFYPITVQRWPVILHLGFFSHPVLMSGTKDDEDAADSALVRKIARCYLNVKN